MEISKISKSLLANDEPLSTRTRRARGIVLTLSGLLLLFSKFSVAPGSQFSFMGMSVNTSEPTLYEQLVASVCLFFFFDFIFSLSIDIFQLYLALRAPGDDQPDLPTADLVKYQLEEGKVTPTRTMAAVVILLRVVFDILGPCLLFAIGLLYWIYT